MPVIGFLGSASADSMSEHREGFRRGLDEMGYADGRNIAIEYRWADDQYDRLPALAQELIRRRVTVLLAGGPPAALAAKAASTSVPIVFVVGFDPVAAGLVASIGHPGGNVTGVTLLSTDLDAKRLELLDELAPKGEPVGVLIDPGYPSAASVRQEMESAAARLHRKVLFLNVGSDGEIDPAFIALQHEQCRGLVVSSSQFFSSNRERLFSLARRYSIPAIYNDRNFATAGGLMSYGASIPNTYRQAGLYTARVLKGENIAGLPVQQPTKFELVINLKTAKALGLAIPPMLLARADAVIE